MKRVLGILLFAAISQWSYGRDLPAWVADAEFGLFVQGANGDWILEPTDSVPNTEGQRYGWVIEVRLPKRSLSVREEYVLPGRSRVAGDNASASRLEIQFDRRRQVSQRQLVPVVGRIYGEWVVGPNEPRGKRHLEVIVEGELAADFEYEVN